MKTGEISADIRPFGQNDPEEYPKSLAALVKIFQFGGVSLGGVDPSHPRDNGRMRLFPMIWNVLSICLLFIAIYIFLIQEENTNTKKSSEPEFYTKPILRFLINSVLYLFAVSGAFCMIYYSYLRGRAIIAHLSDMSILTQDNDKSISKKLVRQLALFMAIVNVSGTLVHVYFATPAKDRGKIFRIDWGRKVLRVIVLQIIYNAAIFVPMVHNIIFIYVVQIYSRQLRHFRYLNSSISIAQLSKLKNQLIALQEHFMGTVELLQVSILFSIMSNTSITIGSLCMLLIINTLVNIKFLGFVCLVIVHSLLTLFIIIYYGDRVHLEYNKLLNHIRHRIVSWNSINLLYLLRLSSSCNPKFNVSLFKVFTLNQATLITLSTFVLNYIVLLIQTDHSKAFSGPAGNKTTSDNVTLWNNSTKA